MWAGFLAGSDRVALEPHPYFAFDGAGAASITPYINQPCTAWGATFNTSQTAFGVTTAGEWSLAFNDCELCPPLSFAVFVCVCDVVLA